MGGEQFLTTVFVVLCSFGTLSKAERSTDCSNFFSTQRGWQNACGCQSHPNNKLDYIKCEGEQCAELCCSEDIYITCKDWANNLGTCQSGFVTTPEDEVALCSSHCRCNATTCCTAQATKPAPAISIVLATKEDDVVETKTCAEWLTRYGGESQACLCGYHSATVLEACPESGCSHKLCCEPNGPSFQTCQDWLDRHGPCKDSLAVSSPDKVDCSEWCHCNATLCCYDSAGANQNLLHHAAATAPVVAGTGFIGKTGQIGTAISLATVEDSWMVTTAAAGPEYDTDGNKYF